MEILTLIILVFVVVFCISYEYGRIYETKKGAFIICRYFEQMKPYKYAEFYNYCKGITFYNPTVKLEEQDFTMFIGMCRGFFYQYGIDCGYGIKQVKRAIRKL